MKPAFRLLCLAALLSTAAGASAQPAESGRRPLVSYAAFSLQQRASVDANEASLRLGKAQLERTRGADALRSERAPGVDNLVHRRYWLRQEKLRHAVETAQRRSNDTLRPQRLVLRASAAAASRRRGE